MSLVPYNDSDEEQETDKSTETNQAGTMKPIKRLPLPFPTESTPTTTTQRKRSVPHIEGNWMTTVYFQGKFIK